MSSDESVAGRDFDSDPLSYPGAVRRESLLVLPTCEHALAPRPLRRLGQARITQCESCQRANQGVLPLNYALLIENVANIDNRYPVVAVGSNASPEVMRGKLSRAGMDVVMPSVIGKIRNIRIAHSAHAGRPGFIPAAPAHVDGELTDVTVTWLDHEQLRCLDQTEPNYHRVHVTAGDYPLTLEGGELLESFYIYDSKWGVLAEAGQALLLRPQRETSAWLAEKGLEPWADADPEAAAKALSQSEQLRQQVREAFDRKGLRIPSGLESTPDGAPRDAGRDHSAPQRLQR